MNLILKIISFTISCPNDNHSNYIIIRNNVETKRTISERLKMKFIDSIRKLHPKVILRAWLKLPYFLENPYKVNMNKLFRKDNSFFRSKTKLAIAQFYKGNWGKAYKTLTNEEHTQELIYDEEINKLYPCQLKRDEQSLELKIPESEKSTCYITNENVKTIISKLPN